MKYLFLVYRVLLLVLLNVWILFGCLNFFLARYVPCLKKFDMFMNYRLHLFVSYIFFGSKEKKIMYMNDLKLPKKKPLIIIANHQSWLDSIYLMCFASKHYVDYRFIVGRFLMHFPGFGWYMRLKKFPFMHSSFYIERASFNSKKRMIKENQESIKNSFKEIDNSYDLAWVVFPEAARSKDRGLTTCKPKAAAMMHYVDVMQEDIQCIDFTIKFPKAMSTAASFLSMNDPMKVWRKSFIIPKGIKKPEMQKVLDDVWLEKEKLLQSEE